MQLNLFEGLALKDRGQRLAAMHRQDALNLARDVAEKICILRGSATADDVREWLGIGPGRQNGQNWLGSIFKDKRFWWDGEVQTSEIPSNHARMIKVWRLA
jgi:hypothetical protein